MGENTIVLTDEDMPNQVLDALMSRLSGDIIQWDPKVRVLTSDEIEIISDISKEVITKDIFFERYEGFADKLNIKKLLEYSEHTDHNLYRDLQAGKSSADSLWNAYKRNLDRGCWELSFFVPGVIEDEAKQNDYPNIVAVLFNHDLVSASFGDKEIPYHMIARGFIAEGFRASDLRAEDGKKYAGIVVPISLVSNLDQEEKISYGTEILNHEIVGHELLGLKDHIDVQPEDCIMAIATSRDKTIEIARQNRGLKFCRNCQEVYKTFLNS